MKALDYLLLSHYENISQEFDEQDDQYWSFGNNSSTQEAYENLKKIGLTVSLLTSHSTGHPVQRIKLNAHAIAQINEEHAKRRNFKGDFNPKLLAANIEKHFEDNYLSGHYRNSTASILNLIAALNVYAETNNLYAVIDKIEASGQGSLPQPDTVAGVFRVSLDPENHGNVTQTIQSMRAEKYEKNTNLALTEALEAAVKALETRFGEPPALVARLETWVDNFTQYLNNLGSSSSSSTSSPVRHSLTPSVSALDLETANLKMDTEHGVSKTIARRLAKLLTPKGQDFIFDLKKAPFVEVIHQGLFLGFANKTQAEQLLNALKADNRMSLAREMQIETNTHALAPRPPHSILLPHDKVYPFMRCMQFDEKNVQLSVDDMYKSKGLNPPVYTKPALALNN